MGFYPRNDNGRWREHAHEDDQSRGGFVHQMYQMFMELGRQSSDHGELNSAITLYKNAVGAKPDSALAWYNYGDALLAARRTEEALPALLKAIELAPDVPLFHYDLGFALHCLERYEEAGKEFADIVSNDPQLKKASSSLVYSSMTDLALGQDALGHTQQALETLTPALRIAGQILYNLGRFHLHAHNYAEGLRLMQAATVVEPDMEDVIHGIGWALRKLERYQEGIPYLRRATRLNPKCEDAWFDLGICLARTKQRKKARSCFRKTLSFNPKDYWSYYELACLDALEGKRSSAFKNLESAVSYGYRRAAHARRDEDLRSLRRDRRWKAILKTMSQHAST
jgi:tetratricopeptide (TPR) repeat protein